MPNLIDREGSDERISAAMRAFAETFRVDDERWDSIVEGSEQGYVGSRPPSSSHRRAFSIAAAVVVGAMIVGGSLLWRGDVSQPVVSTATEPPATDPSTTSEPPPVTTTTPPSTSSVPDIREMEIPEGKVPVADHEGGIAGFVDAEASESPEGYPPLDLPSEAQVKGLAVTDVDGVLVGYFIEGFGFVELDVAERPGGIDDLIAQREAEIADLPPEIRDQTEEFEQRGEEEGLQLPPG